MLELTNSVQASTIRDTAYLSSQSGYTIIEALIAASISAIASVGLWQLAVATTTLATKSFNASRPNCDAPQCAPTDRGLSCTCGDYTFIIVR
ncbi:MAG: prepilin-type N-terminal cleavage/methylation domain-containing protein [Pseudomonadota bacterium]|jgi:hypothetical protein